MSVNLDEYVQQAISEGRGWSEEDKEAYLASLRDQEYELPLFAESAAELDPTLAEALRAIGEEGETPETMADHHKARGNDFFKKGRMNKMYFVHAAQSYTTALGYAERAGETDEMTQLKSTLLSNRAMAHMMRKNFGSARRDAELALKFDPNNVKAHYRRVKACYELKVYEDCLRAAAAALELDPENAEIQQIRNKAQVELEKLRAREEANQRKLQARTQRHQLVWDGCTARKIRLGYSRLDSFFHPQDINALPLLNEDGSMSFPVIMFCPQYQQLEHIQECNENDMIALHMAVLYPEEGEALPWDEEDEYRCSNLQIYVQLQSVPRVRNSEEWQAALEEQRAYRGELGPDEAERVIAVSEKRLQKHNPGKWLEVHPGCTLGRVLGHPKMVTEAGVVVFHVFAKNNRAHRKFLMEAKDSIEMLEPTLISK